MRKKRGNCCKHKARMDPNDFQTAILLGHKGDAVNRNNGEVFTLLDSSPSEAVKSGYRKIKNYLANEIYAQGYYFDNQDQLLIDELVDKANAVGKEEFYIYPVWEVEDPKIMIRSGFFPTSFHFGEKWCVDWFNGMDIDSLNFWWGNVLRDIGTIIGELKHESRWVYYSMEYWKKKASQKGDSTGLMLFAPEYTYESKRPITDMIIFRTPRSFRCFSKDIQDNKLLIAGT